MDTLQVHRVADSLAVRQASADTAYHALMQNADQVEKAEGNLFTELLHHTQDSRHLELPFAHIALPQFPPVHVAGITIDLSVTKHVVFLWVAGATLIILALLAARSNAKRPVPRGFGNLVEVLVMFIRDEVVIPNMGPKGMMYMPYLLTTFFFILGMNLWGLIPYGASPTGNVSVTAGLAIIAFVMIQASAIRAQGLKRYLAHLTGGVHWVLWPIMIPIEILGLFTKPFALCVRLFANMTGGHIVIVSLIGLIFIFRSYVIAVAPAGFVVGIMFLELFVALLQAYIFTMLTSLFMGLGMQAEGHDGGTEGGH
jgi:F-type H+-transporting ATPase subunit a